MRQFHIKKNTITIWLVIALVILVFALVGLLYPKSSSSLYSSLFFLVISAAVLLFMFRLPVSIELGEQEMVIKRLIGAVHIPRAAVKQVTLGESGKIDTPAQQGLTVYVQDARTGKTIPYHFTSIEENDAEFYTSLLKWAGIVESKENPRTRIS